MRDSGQMSPTEYEQERARLLASAIPGLAKCSEDAYKSGDLATAEALCEKLAVMGDAHALRWLGGLAEDDGDSLTALRLYESAAGHGDGEAAYNAGSILEEAGDHEVAARWHTRAVELGYARARTSLGQILWRTLDDRDRGETLLRAAALDDDPDAIEILSFLQLRDGEISGDEFDTRFEEAARLRLAVELKGQAWAQVEDLSGLTDEEIHRLDDEFARWKVWKDEMCAVVEEKGIDALPRPNRDRAKLKAMTERGLEWVDFRVADARQRCGLAEAKAEGSKAKLDGWLQSPEGREWANLEASKGPSRGLDIRGCRLVAGQISLRKARLAVSPSDSQLVNPSPCSFEGGPGG